MQGECLRFYLHENDRLHGRLTYDWLLDKARAAGIGGGSALRAIAGFGRHGVLHEDHFFELAGDLPVVVEFFVTPDKGDELLRLLEAEKVSLFYTRWPARFDLTGRKS